MRVFVVFLGLIIMSVTAITIARSKATDKSAGAITTRSSVAARATLQDPIGTIDGSVTPEQIPDEVAYSLFFNFIAGRGTEKAKSSLRAYMQQVQLADIDLENLTLISDEYQNAVRSLDTEQSALVESHHHNMAEIEAELNSLQLQRQLLVSAKVALLTSRLGATGAEKVRRHVMEYIKRKVKIIPGPGTPQMAH
jgi:hypothetical protein